jgi:hypothetical protein
LVSDLADGWIADDDGFGCADCSRSRGDAVQNEVGRAGE